MTDGIRDGSAVTGVRGRDGSTLLSAHGQMVVGADGLRSTVATLVDAPTTTTGPSSNAVIYGCWEGVEVPGYEWFYRPGFATGVFPTNDRRTLVFTTVPPARFREEAVGDLDGALRATLVEHSPELLARLDGGVRVERLRGFRGQAGLVRRPWGRGWAEKIASREWTMPEVKTLLIEMSRSTSDEVAPLESLPSAGASRGPGLDSLGA